MGFADHELKVARRHPGEHIVIEFFLLLVQIACGQAGDVPLKEDRSRAEPIKDLPNPFGLHDNANLGVRRATNCQQRQSERRG